MERYYSYNLGYISFGGFFSEYKEIYVVAELNYAANVILVDEENFNKYLDGDSFVYYGGHTKKTPCSIEIPHSGKWFVVIDNGGDSMDGIKAKVYLDKYR